ncbi:MAG: type II secretion system F family protein [Verrucomicrobiota bacterium]|jgi:type IV pilus assembly protein PilC|nr:type II secretion system F family protein [Verrucomicrobiota bacterium]MDD8050106.1 type II secretion system F family protein [Verrucomicrobiota bacterium]MDI9383061.1 type II secretion system F family protein [Verrucomicrobiota bacterium]
MPTFQYKARTRQGELVSGSIEAQDRRTAVGILSRKGYVPFHVEGGTAKPASTSSAGGTNGKSARKPGSGLLGLFGKGTAKPQPANGKASTRPAPQPAVKPSTAAKPRSAFSKTTKGFSATNLLGRWGAPGRLTIKHKPRLRDIARFTRQLANLIKAGMALRQALASLSRQTDLGLMQPIVHDLHEQIVRGSSLSDALSQHPDAFNALFINMVRAGEASGQLHQVLRQLNEYQEQTLELREKVTTAMVYPSFIMLVGFGVVVFFMTVMLPKFAKMFEDFGSGLPASTQIMVDIGLFCRQKWWLIALIVFGLSLLFKRWKSTPDGRHRLDSWKLRMPVFGRVVRANAFVQFSRTLGTLLGNGVPVLSALRILSRTITNRVIAGAIEEAEAKVTDGTTISQPLARSGVFPNTLLEMLSIGEQTGDMPGALENIAETYEQEMDRDIKIMTSMLEPIVIVVMALFVGFIIFSILMAVFEMTSGLTS